MTLLIDHRGPRLVAREPRLFSDPVPVPRAPEPAAEPAVGASGRTLDDLLTGTWDRLTAGVATACPVCAGALSPRWSAGSGIVGGRCGDCGSELS
jgi:hypothetical protein